MKTLEDVLQILNTSIDRPTVEAYIARDWLRPVATGEGLYFEDIDIARLQLICHLAHDIEVNEDGMDVVLSLLDQLYGLRAHMQQLAHAIAQQPSQVRTDIEMAIEQLSKAGDMP